MDINRSLERFPPRISDEDRPELQDQITRLIIRVLDKHPELNYYQGYHDVAITLLLVVGEEMSFHILERLSTGPWLRVSKIQRFFFSMQRYFANVIIFPFTIGLYASYNRENNLLVKLYLSYCKLLLNVYFF